MLRPIRPCFTAFKVYEKNGAAYTIKSSLLIIKCAVGQDLKSDLIQRKKLIVFKLLPIQQSSETDWPGLFSVVFPVVMII